MNDRVYGRWKLRICSKVTPAWSCICSHESQSQHFILWCGPHSLWQKHLHLCQMVILLLPHTYISSIQEPLPCIVHQLVSETFHRWETLHLWGSPFTCACSISIFSQVTNRNQSSYNFFQGSWLTFWKHSEHISLVCWTWHWILMPEKLRP